MKTVILVGHIGPWRADPEGAEIWGVNRSFLKQCPEEGAPSLTRLYFLDSLEALSQGMPEYAERVNALGIPVVANRHWPQVPLSRPYDLEAAHAYFGRTYYTSSPAYMIADAIREGFEKIICHRLYVNLRSEAHAEQIAGCNYWLGQAEGRGIKVVFSQDGYLARPLPWQANTYGFVPNNPAAKALMAWGFDPACNVRKLEDKPAPVAAKVG